MHIKDIIVENEPQQQRRPKLSMKELDVKAKEELTDKIFTYPGGPRQTEYFNIPFQATIQLAKTEYYKSNQVSVGNAVDKAVKFYQDNPAQAEKEMDKEEKTPNKGTVARPGAPLGNQNAAKRGAPLGNQNARKFEPGAGLGGIMKGVRGAIDTAKAIKDFNVGDTASMIGRGQNIAGQAGNLVKNVAQYKKASDRGFTV